MSNSAKEEINRGGGAIGIIRDGLKGIRIIANWTQMDGIVNERHLVETTVVIYYTAVKRNKEGEAVSFKRILLNEEKLYFHNFYEDYDKTIMLSSLQIPIGSVPSGYTLLDSIMIGTFDNKYVEHSIVDCPEGQFVPSPYHLVYKKRGLSNGIHTIELTQWDAEND